MSDPKRLFEDGADELGKSLLSAGRTLDAEQARARKLALLGAAGAAAATAVATPAAAAATKGAIHLVSAAALKWLGVGLVAAAVATGGALYFVSEAPEAQNRPEAPAGGGPAPENPSRDPSNSVVTGSNTDPLKPPGDAPAGETGGAPAPIEGDPDVDAPRAKTSAPSREPPHAEPKTSPDPAASPSGDSLADEVTALKRAREALAAGRPSKALIELNIYDKRFRGGRLALEAEVLRIEALAQSGEGKAAAARAASFLKAHPSSPYANRVRAIAEGPKGATSE
jgi:hypothetical protein